MKKMLSVMVVCLLIFGILAGCGSQPAQTAPPASGGTAATPPASSGDVAVEPEFSLKLGHVVADNTPLNQGALMFADMVKERTGGKVVVEVYPNAVLGDNRAGMEALQFGTADLWIPNMATISGYTSMTKAFELPYIIKNDEAANLIFDGPIIEEAVEVLKDSGILYLSSFSQGWREVTTTDREVHVPADMKGLKLRTMDSELHMDHFNALGASAIPLPFGEVFTALQQGTIDAQENPYTNIYTQAYHEVQKYVIETNHICDITPFLMSQIAYDKLPAEYRDIVIAAAKEMAPIERQMVAEGEAAMKQAIIDSGRVTMIELTPEEKQQFIDAAQPVYDKWAAEIGPEFLQKVIDAQKDIQ